MNMHEAAAGGQHGDGRRNSHGRRAPPTPVTAGLSVHRGLLKKPGLVIASCCTEWEVTAR
jgi:hypothetical protein